MTDEIAQAAPQVHYQNTAEDWDALQKAFFAQQQLRTRLAPGLLVGGFVITCCLPGMLLLLALGQFMAFGLAVLTILAFTGFAFRSIRRSGPPDEKTLRPTTLVLRAQFLEVFGGLGWERRDWAMIDRVQTTDTLMILYRDDGLVYAVPRRAFSSPEVANAFLQTVQTSIEQGKLRGRPVSPAPWQVGSGPPLVQAADTMQVTYSTSAKEVQESHAGVVLHPVDAPPKKASRSPRVLPFLLLAAAMALVLANGRLSGNSMAHNLTAYLVFIVISLVMIWPVSRLLAYFAIWRSAEPPSGEQTVTIAPEGVSLWAPGLETTSDWETIDGVQENDSLIVFSANRPMVVYLYVIPKSAFADEYAARRFAESASRYQKVAVERVQEQELAQPRRVETGNPYQAPQTR